MIDNFLTVARTPSLHLRNADGSISNLPWDIASQFQQHAVPTGIALILVAAYVFIAWQQRSKLSPLLLSTSVALFGVSFLGHACFGAMGSACAGLMLAWSWFREPTKNRFWQAVVFGAGVTLLAFLHGGILSSGAEYGQYGAITLRDSLGYAKGGFRGFVHWNLAGFGVLLILALGALWVRYRDSGASESKRLFFLFFATFAACSYALPQFVYYSSETSRVEQFTEISKFFFCSHLGLALMSVYAIALIVRYVRIWMLAPALALLAITPLANCYAGSFDADGRWLGFYHSPHSAPASAYKIEMGDALAEFKGSNRDVYFDFSAEERRGGYLSELLIFGGSVFTLTPSRYERTGVGYRLAEHIVAEKFVHNGRVARLAPGSPEEAGCGWFYVKPFEDLATAPLIVRSRFEKMKSDGYITERLEAGPRALYSVDRPTRDLDDGIEAFWAPRIVSQTRSDWDGDGKEDLIYFDYHEQKILLPGESLDLPDWLKGQDSIHLYVASFPGEARVDFLIGRMGDTNFQLGEKIDEVIESSGFYWSYQDSYSAYWQPEYQHWDWGWDLPYIASVNKSGIDSHLSYRPRTGEWFMAPNRPLSGPSMAEDQLPLPLAGRFLPGSEGDLGLWSQRTGTVLLRSLSDGQTVSFEWGGLAGDVLVPGDYTGDGFDEIAIWQRESRTWYWRKVPDGAISEVTFGSATGIPLPADYDDDGRVDLAYWEPAAAKIFVSLSQGRSVDLTLNVPPHSIPAFVNMY